MGRINILTVRGVEAARDPGLVSDGAGLYLRVAPGGTKGWILRFRSPVHQGRRRDMGLGSYPTIGLADARAKAAAARRLLDDGKDPIDEAAAPALPPAAAVPTVSALLEEHIAAVGPTWRSPKHAKQWRATLTAHASAILAMQVDRVGPAEVAAALAPIWTKRPETARRVRGRLEVLLNRAEALGLIQRNPAALKIVSRLLPRQKDTARHFAAVQVAEAQATYRLIAAAPGSGARALQFVALTAARSGEVRALEWRDIGADIITFRPETTKSGREHVIPITPSVRTLLDGLPRMRGDFHVFASTKRGRPLSDMSLTATLRRLKIAATAHGWRSTFRDWVAESGLDGEAAERQLSHLPGSQTVAAYLRTDLLDRRRALMGSWDAWITKPPADA